MLNLSVHADFKRIQRQLDDLAYKQSRFAAAMALTDLAREVQKEEIKALTEVLDHPTPFTLKSIGVRAARKDDLEALVFVKDTAAAYLEPYEFGGLQKLTGRQRAFLNPKHVSLNQYGNVPRGTLSRLKGRSDVFIGTIKSKDGPAYGVWQRLQGDRLKLLFRFRKPETVKRHLGYRDRAAKVVAKGFNAAFGRALAKAIATAK